MRNKMIELGFKGCIGKNKDELYKNFKNEKKIFRLWSNLYSKKNVHLVQRTPPYRSYFQPIEFVWSMLKRWIADQYCEKTNYTILKNRLKKSFERVCSHPEKVDNMINHVIRLEKDCLSKLKEENPNLAWFPLFYTLVIIFIYDDYI